MENVENNDNPIPIIGSLSVFIATGQSGTWDGFMFLLLTCTSGTVQLDSVELEGYTLDAELEAYERYVEPLMTDAFIDFWVTCQQ